MDITITINTDNAAFEGPYCQHEVARILSELATKIKRNGIYDGNLRDGNGNTVGAIKAEP